MAWRERRVRAGSGERLHVLHRRRWSEPVVAVVSPSANGCRWNTDRRVAAQESYADTATITRMPAPL